MRCSECGSTSFVRVPNQAPACADCGTQSQQLEVSDVTEFREGVRYIAVRGRGQASQPAADTAAATGGVSHADVAAGVRAGVLHGADAHTGPSATGRLPRPPTSLAVLGLVVSAQADAAVRVLGASTESIRSVRGIWLAFAQRWLEKFPAGPTAVTRKVTRMVSRRAMLKRRRIAKAEAVRQEATKSASTQPLAPFGAFATAVFAAEQAAGADNNASGSGSSDSGSAGSDGAVSDAVLPAAGSDDESELSLELNLDQLDQPSSQEPQLGDGSGDDAGNGDDSGNGDDAGNTSAAVSVHDDSDAMALTTDDEHDKAIELAIDTFEVPMLAHTLSILLLGLLMAGEGVCEVEVAAAAAQQRLPYLTAVHDHIPASLSDSPTVQSLLRLPSFQVPQPAWLLRNTIALARYLALMPTLPALHPMPQLHTWLRALHLPAEPLAAWIDVLLERYTPPDLLRPLAAWAPNPSMPRPPRLSLMAYLVIALKLALRLDDDPRSLTHPWLEQWLEQRVAELLRRNELDIPWCCNTAPVTESGQLHVLERVCGDILPAARPVPHADVPYHDMFASLSRRRRSTRHAGAVSEHCVAEDASDVASFGVDPPLEWIDVYAGDACLSLGNAPHPRSYQLVVELCAHHISVRPVVLARAVNRIVRSLKLDTWS